MTTDPILEWLHKQIKFDKWLYPFTDRSWEYESNFSDKEGRSAKSVILHPRRWHGRDAWWRVTLSSFRFFLGIGRDTTNLRTILLQDKREISWPVIKAAFIGGWNDHIDRSDALVGGDPIAWDEKALYVAEWDPERTDREARLKQDLLAQHYPYWSGTDERCRTDESHWPCMPIRSLIDVYQHRKGYRPEWGLRAGTNANETTREAT